MSRIDFVVTWVDGNDPLWIAERTKLVPADDVEAIASVRFRDWGLMKYWFRGIEKFAPWVNKIYFVTWGHYPEWLNLEHPKLKIVKHTDYIPQKFLPTFNSNVIELNLHRITDLSENFVLFNDDMFLLDAVRETDFFKEGVPCDTALLGTIACANPEDTFPHTLLNNTAIINKYFIKRNVIRKQWGKFFTLKYGKALLRNICTLPFPKFSMFVDTHLPTSHVKETFYEVWERESELLAESGKYRFRSKEDISHWLLKNWYICQGKFLPRRKKWGKCFKINSFEALEAIEKQRYKAICLNDTGVDMDFDAVQRKVIAAFEKILPEKSSFEK